MASITSLMGSSSSSSLYGNRNIISGLASGMDTEAMIENAVSGYQTKITNLQQDRTKVEWEQEAYRSIINKMAVFSNTYADYISSTNLMSTSFFSSAVDIESNGVNASKISATGKMNDSLQILGVKQLATAATYTVSGNFGYLGAASEKGNVIQGGALNLSDTTKVSSISGTLTLKDNGGTYKINLDSTVYEDSKQLVDEINKQLDAIYADRETTYKIEASLSADGSSITFSGGENAYISGASGAIKDTLGIQTGEGNTTISLDGKALYTEPTKAEQLSGKEISFTLDGVTKKINLGEVDSSKGVAGLVETLNTELASKFGAKRIKVSGDEASGLTFTTDEGSSLAISGGAALGLASDNETSYVNANKTLSGLLGADLENYKTTDDKGNTYYEFKINGKTIGKYSADTNLDTILSDINRNSAAGVTVNYSKITNEFVFSARETGEVGEIKFEGLSQALFGDTTDSVKKGQNAIFTVSVDGGGEKDLTRSSNVVNLDGMTVTLKGEFGYEKVTDDQGNVTYNKLDDTEAVTFTSTTDADKIIETIRSMVKDYNELANEIKSAYSTMPATKTNGDYYEPLTDEDRADMSESAIENYEEKAKQGLLFGDRDLSNLYDRLRSAISLSGQARVDMEAIGLTVEYSNGKTTLALDESKLRSALETDPDKVAGVFNDSKTGLMQSLKDPLEDYGKTIGTKGILVEKAGSELSPSSLYQNSLQSELDDYDEKIAKWQEKLSDKIDYYTRQFTLLEQLVNEMNSQSSALMGLMGG